MNDNAESPDTQFEFVDWLQNLLFISMIRVLRWLPYEKRLAAMGWASKNVVGPLSGYRRRARKNLKLIYPDKPQEERGEIADKVLENFGRGIMENYSHKEFREKIKEMKIEGPGLEAARAAQAEGRPIIFTSGHYSNHEATRTALDLAGFKVGGLYKPASNRYFNAHYVETGAVVSGPVFPLGKAGTVQFFRFLKKGGQGFLLHDVYVHGAQHIDFLGKPARTAVSAAELVLKLNGVLIPYFNTRQPDGVSFKIELLDPIPASDARTMTVELVRLLEERIHEDPSQWLWIHRRWKGVPGAA
ncbi:MAG: lauroyl acyltransferase [Pseudomonadota bacterium]